MKTKEQYIEWVEREIEVAGWSESPLGPIIFQYITTAYDMTKGNPNMISMFNDIINKLTWNVPASPITHPKESPEDWYTDGVTIRSKRCPTVYIDQNMVAKDDHAVAYNNERDNVYFDSSSTREITFPYDANPEIVKK
jgi:hypothetical protein